MQPNLNSSLVHGIKGIEIQNFKTSKCKQLFCGICPFINSSFTFPLKNKTLPILCDSDCNSSNLVYLITCKKCNVFYIGETMRTLNLRISEHLNTIKKIVVNGRFWDFVVARHFFKDHNLYKDFCVQVIRKDFIDIYARKNYESFLIQLFRYLEIKTLNDT